MVDVKIGNLTFEGVDSVKLNTTDGGEVVFTLGGGEVDHSVEDALFSGTLEHYVNDRVTSIGFMKYHFTSPFWFSRETLKSVSMAKVEHINRSAFSDCTKLESVNFPSVKYIETEAFYGCCSLKEVNFPSVVTLEGSVFGCCDNLTHLVLPNATTIGGRAFALTSLSPVVIDLPKATSFDEEVFPGYTNVHILLRSETVAALGGNIDAEYCFEGYIYVPRSLVDSYKTAENWNNYANRFRALEDYTVDGTITGELDMSKV